MKVLNQLKSLKINIQELRKLNEDLVEKNYANSIKIKALENKISILKRGISQNIKVIEKYIKKNANS